jgi:hypothetical protein
MNRLKQGSTWAGIGVILTTIGNFIPGYGIYLIALGAAAASAAGVLNS